MNAPLTQDTPKKLDDVMLAMDIVDTLRHRARIVDQELSSEAREAKLVERLREIYAAQGIEVPDRILHDGVKALEENRFVYEPPKASFAVSLAKFYIARDRWLKPVAIIAAIAAVIAGAFEIGVNAPRAARAEATRIELTETLPANLAEMRDAAHKVATSDDARRRIETVYQDGLAASSASNAEGARAAVEDLTRMRDLIGKDLTIRIISRPREMSGVFRVHDDNRNVKNYYLIVEGVDANGRPQAFDIQSEEDQTTARVTKWGIRVSEGLFNRVAADKQDDQIIQNAVVGRKPVGALAPNYSIATSGGTIVSW